MRASLTSSNLKCRITASIFFTSHPVAEKRFRHKLQTPPSAHSGRIPRIVVTQLVLSRRTKVAADKPRCQSKNHPSHATDPGRRRQVSRHEGSHFQSIRRASAPLREDKPADPRQHRSKPPQNIAKPGAAIISTSADEASIAASHANHSTSCCRPSILRKCDRVHRGPTTLNRLFSRSFSF